MPTLAERACCTPTAAGSSAGGTTARVAPTELAPKNTSPVPSTSAITGTTQNTGSTATTTASTPSDAARRTSAASMIRRRGQRSAAIPATQPEQRARQEAGERDEACLRGGVGEGEGEQRVGDAREGAACGGEELAGLEEDEVTVPAQRHPTPSLTARRSRYAVLGSASLKRAPDAFVSAVAVPPCASAASRTIARPRPAPGFERAAAAR